MAEELIERMADIAFAPGFDNDRAARMKAALAVVLREMLKPSYSVQNEIHGTADAVHNHEDFNLPEMMQIWRAGVNAVAVENQIAITSWLPDGCPEQPLIPVGVNDEASDG